MSIKQELPTKKDAKGAQAASGGQKSSHAPAEDRTPVGSLNREQGAQAAFKTPPSEKIQGQGKLADWSSRLILDYLHGKRFSGFLLLSNDGRKKKIWFKEGEISRVQTNLIPELLGERMIQKGWLQKDDIAQCLAEQNQMQHVKPQPIGVLAQAKAHLTDEELSSLIHEQQTLGLIQAMGWSEGEYLFKSTQENPAVSLFDKASHKVRWIDIRLSVKRLFETVPVKLGPLFEKVAPWQPSQQAIDLRESPVWKILAGCRQREISGILSIRKQQRLFEIVIKEGIPVTFYEGSFQQPRSTMIFRRATEDHELSFQHELYKLFSFVTGTASFRVFDEHKEKKAIAQITVQKIRLQDPHEDDESLAFELRSQFLSEERTILEKTYTGVTKKAHILVDKLKNIIRNKKP